jgi:anti-sigma factor RsiW
MSCPEFDLKGHILGETPPDEGARYDQHLAACAACREEAEELRLTLQAMRRLPEREAPRRIAFVSDPVFEPGWWQRFLLSGPRVAFASAAMLSLAIVAHALIPRPGAVAPADVASIERRVEAEVAKRLPVAVNEQVRAELKPALDRLASRLDELENTRLASVEKRFERQRAEDIRDVRGAFESVERKLSAIQMVAARYGGE